MADTDNSSPIVRFNLALDQLEFFNGADWYQAADSPGSGGGSPGGTTGALQYNNAGSFGGDDGITTDGTGDLTITGSLSVNNGPDCASFDDLTNTIQAVFSHGGFAWWLSSNSGGLYIQSNDGSQTVQLSPAQDIFNVVMPSGAFYMNSGAFKIFSTVNGFQPPAMTTVQKNAIASPTAGTILYDTNLNKLCVYNGSAWETVTSM